MPAWILSICMGRGEWWDGEEEESDTEGGEREGRQSETAEVNSLS